MTILYYSCTQEKEFVNEHNHSKINYEEKSFKEALSLSLFNDALKKIAKKRGAFRSEAEAKTALEEQFGFTIVEDAPVRIVTDENGIIFYTILIERVDKVELVFENLMIQLDGEDVSAAIIRYTMAEKGVLSPTGEYTIKEITTTTYTDLNIEGKMFFNANGDTCFDWFVFKCDDQLGYTHTAYSACFNNNTAYPVLSTVCLGDNVAGNGETINVGGGDSGPSSNNNGGLGSSSGVPNNVPLSPIICRTGNCIEADIETPCDKLNELFDSSPGKPNLKPILVALQGTLPQNGENGRTLKKTETGQFGAPSIPATNNNAINGPVGLLIFGEIHTHPFQGPHAAYPMFSWTDVHRLLEIYDHTAVYNQPDVVVMLVTQDDAGVNQVYSLVIDDVIAYKNMINQKLNELNLLLPYERKLDKLNEVLGDRYFSDNNYERAFLEHFADFNVSLYKADSSLTNWEKLSLAQPISSTPASNTTTSTPCN